MAIDINKIKYHVELLTENGTKYVLNNILLDLSWEENLSELAQRARLTVANYKIDDTYFINLAKINCILFIFAIYNNIKTLLFEGTIWDWEYTSTAQKELTVTAYDYLIRLQKSKDFKYYSAGMNTKDIIETICKDWSIPVKYEWESITHQKKSFRGQTISDMIINILEEVKNKTSNNYVIYLKDKTLHIAPFGINKDIYVFTGSAVTSTYNKLSMDNLVTKVKVIGKEDKEGRSSLEANLDGKLEFGTYQDIVMRDGDKTIAEAITDAEIILKENGSPKEEIKLVALDIPFFRKGDKIKVSAGNLIGYFFILGISHDAVKGLMTMELKNADHTEFKIMKHVYVTENEKTSGTISESGYSSGNMHNRNSIVDVAKSYIGKTTYNMSKAVIPPVGNIFDCSSFVSWCFIKSNAFPKLGRQTAQSLYHLCSKLSKSNVIAGDLVFFKGTYKPQDGRLITHVGICTGDGRMIHTGGNPVGYDNPHSAYWQKYFHSYGRLV